MNRDGLWDWMNACQGSAISHQCILPQNCFGLLAWPQFHRLSSSLGPNQTNKSPVMVSDSQALRWTANLAAAGAPAGGRSQSRLWTGIASRESESWHRWWNLGRSLEVSGHLLWGCWTSWTDSNVSVAETYSIIAHSDGKSRVRAHETNSSTSHSLWSDFHLGCSYFAHNLIYLLYRRTNNGPIMLSTSC